MNIVERLKDSLEYEYNLSFSERKQLLEEIDRLNNIINELEKYIIGETELNNGALLCGLSSDTEKDQYGIENNIYDNILDKLKELKEDNKDV